MEKPVIYVKYCGGCNPTFERREVRRKIERCLGICIDPVRDDLIPEITLVVNGCKSECIRSNEYISRIKTLLIDDINDLDKVIEEIKDIINK